MRLSDLEKQGIIDAVNKICSSNHYELRLYGSRADDTKKGGDIDLLLILSNHKEAETLRYKKWDLLTELIKNIGEQKIDLSIATQDEIYQKAFLKMAYTDSVVIAKK